MFTGLVEAVGTVSDFRKTSAVYRLAIDCSQIAPELVLGQSVAVSGACLTVVSLKGDIFEVEMIPETASRTNLSSLVRGMKVNLERALKLGDRLDGHMVQGHVDGTAKLKSLTGGQTRTAYFEAKEDLLRGIVPKGSVAIDGVSLTVIDAGRTEFSVGLIPATLTNCTLGFLKPGDIVNIETDIIGKYVERLLGGIRSSGSLSIEELKKLGY